MAKTTTTRYDVAEHLRTPDEMAAYLEACLVRILMIVNTNYYHREHFAYPRIGFRLFLP